MQDQDNKIEIQEREPDISFYETNEWAKRWHMAYDLILDIAARHQPDNTQGEVPRTPDAIQTQAKV